VAAPGRIIHLPEYKERAMRTYWLLSLALAAVGMVVYAAVDVLT